MKGLGYFLGAFFGAILGVGLTLIVIVIVNHRSAQKSLLAIQEIRTTGATDSLNNNNTLQLVGNIGDIQRQMDIVDEKVGFLHSRISDFYIFSGIVITLLLAINVGVFVKADDEVEKYMKQNHERHLSRIREISEQCEGHLANIRSRDIVGDQINSKNPEPPHTQSPTSSNPLA